MNFEDEIGRFDTLIQGARSLDNAGFMKLYSSLYIPKHKCRPTLTTNCPACEAKYEKVMEEVADATL